jgi:hypothetical protein
MAHVLQVDASLPLAGEYACVRWARRMPQAAAAAFLESQGAADVGPLESQVCLAAGADVAVPPNWSPKRRGAASAAVCANQRCCCGVLWTRLMIILTLPIGTFCRKPFLSQAARGAQGPRWRS